MTLSACGVKKHPPHCTCDVSVTQPAPVNYHFHDVEWGAIVARAVGHRRDDGGEKLADYLEALSHAVDAIDARRNQRYDGDWRELRQAVLSRLQTMSMIDVPEALGVCYADCLHAVIDDHKHSVKRWGEEDWAIFEDYIRSQRVHHVRQVCQRFGMENGLAVTLIHAYGCETYAEWRQRALVRLLELREQYPKAKLTELARWINDEGFTFTPHGVGQALRKHHSSEMVPA